MMVKFYQCRSGKSSTIFAKSGHINNNEKNLILYNGSIQKLEENGIVNVLNLKKLY